MNPEFDVIIVGSGPAGVSAAFPIVQAGLRVLMIDGGKQPASLFPTADFITARNADNEQWKWMIGENFHSLKMYDAVSPKLRVPAHAYAFEGFGSHNHIEGRDFVMVGSLAKGGLSNAWGCGVARFSHRELTEFPFPPEELDHSYATVSKRIGISGKINDDLSEYFGVDEYCQPPLPMDLLHVSLSQRYSDVRTSLNSQGFRMGRSRVAVLSADMNGRQACSLSRNCLWGCRRRSLYSSTEDILHLRKHRNFCELSGFVVGGLARCEGYWAVEGKETSDNKHRRITGNRIVLAAGTLATTRIAFKALHYRRAANMLSNPTAAFLLWFPKRLGDPRTTGFGLGQLSFSLKLEGNSTAFGSTFSTTGISSSEFVRHMPLRRRHGIGLARHLLSSCLVGNLFLQGHLTNASTTLRADDSLVVTGAYHDAVAPLMQEAAAKLRGAYWNLGALLVPGSFTIGRPGSDIHYAGTLPMRRSPIVGESSKYGEIVGLEGVYVVDGASLPVLTEKSHTLTIMANADRIGGEIANDFTKGTVSRFSKSRTDPQPL